MFDLPGHPALGDADIHGLPEQTLDIALKGAAARVGDPAGMQPLSTENSCDLHRRILLVLGPGYQQLFHDLRISCLCGVIQRAVLLVVQPL